MVECKNTINTLNNNISGYSNSINNLNNKYDTLSNDVSNKMVECKNTINTLNSNLTQNTDGRFVLPNGLKICWGIASTTNGLSTINFPVTFQNNPIVNAIMTGMSYNSTLIVPMIQSISTRNAEIRLTYYNGQWLGEAGENIAWIAIGY